MRNLYLTLAATAAMLAGGLAWTETAEARPRYRAWRYYGPPAARYYYRPYGPIYAYPRYYRPYRYYDSYYGGPAFYWSGPRFGAYDRY
jgi:hypothetical protein